MEWLRKLPGAGKPLKNPTGLPEELLEYLKADLARGDEEYPGLGEALLRYVVDDVGEEVLGHLPSLPVVTEALGLRYARQSSHFFGAMEERKKFFAGIDSIHPGVLYRLCLIYQAVTPPKTIWSFWWDFMPADVQWFAFLFLEGAGYHQLPYEAPPWTVDHIRAVLAHAEAPESTLAELIFREKEPNNDYSYFNQGRFASIGGLGEYFSEQAAVIATAVLDATTPHRAHCLKVLAREKTRLCSPLLEVVVDIALGSAKGARDHAVSLIGEQPAAGKKEIVEMVRERLRTGKAGERTQAVPLLVVLEKKGCHAFLNECRATEKSKSVLAAIDRHIGVATDSKEATPAGKGDDFTVPEPRTFERACSLSEAARDGVLAVLDKFCQEAVDYHARQWDEATRKKRNSMLRALESRDVEPPLSAEDRHRIMEDLETGDYVFKRQQLGSIASQYMSVEYGITALLEKHPLELVPLIRLGYHLGFLGVDEHPNDPSLAKEISRDFVWWLRSFVEHADEAYSLSDIAAAFEAAGLDATWLEGLYTRYHYHAPFNPLGIDDEGIWPFFYRHQEELRKAMGLLPGGLDRNDYAYLDYKQLAYKILATFPTPPQDFVPLLWEQALGGNKTERALAQACLKNVEGREDIIIKHLGDGKKDVREAATRWLRELGVKEAVPALKKTLEKEKHDDVKAAMMEALEVLGEDIDQFLNRKKLLDEAQKGLKKAVPAALDWFPFSALPEVHWAKNKQQVPEEILRWFIVQSCKVKSAEPGSLLRRYCDLMQPDERAVYGKYILDAWLAHDTLPKFTHEEAIAEADKEVEQYKQWDPNWFDTPEEEADVHRAALNRFKNECMGSANPSRGILALSAACCESDVVPQVERYIRHWYGRRMHQCKALIQMLSWIDHPQAIQLILSLANRFRTKGIQQEASKYADTIAERKGWTRDEMADRTIPTAGFDPDGVQIIDYGSRQFTATLLEDFSIQLTNADGKVIKALPNATKADDEDEVKQQKKDFTAAKKELKQVLTFQRERLYEAMCTGRQWPYPDWEQYLNKHPIAGRFCQQLVWLALRDGEVAASFRPLPDRTLTDREDNPVTLESGDTIQLAHQAQLEEGTCTQWLQSLADYEVEPLFTQFGRDSFVLDEEKAKAVEITDFEGHVLTAFKLRSRTGKLGYTRGYAEDGGVFYTYHKNFPSLGIQSVIEFTGNVLPEEDCSVALKKLYFLEWTEDTEDDYRHAHKPLRLDAVHAVILAEAWNDMKQMAADGSGYDETWESIVEW